MYCPYHWHTQEEEAFVVWSGTPTLRTPQGTFELRPGDVVAFPDRRARSAPHLQRERGTVLVLMFANIDAGDVCYYPDSRKIMVESDRRDRPQRTAARLLRRRAVNAAAFFAARSHAGGGRVVAALPRPAHVVVVIEENHTLAQIIGERQRAVPRDGRAPTARSSRTPTA